MSTDENSPAVNVGDTSDRHPADERVDPETLAYTLVEHAADVCGEDAANAYLVRVISEVFAIAPGVLAHVVDKLMGDLKEEIAQREDPRFSRATIALIETIEDEWRNRS